MFSVIYLCVCLFKLWPLNHSRDKLHRREIIAWMQIHQDRRKHSSRMRTTHFGGHHWMSASWGVPSGGVSSIPTPRRDLGPGISSVDRITDRHLWKHYLPATSLAGGKYDVKRSKFIHCISKVSFHIIAVATVAVERLCFHKHLSFCPRGEVYTP